MFEGLLLCSGALVGSVLLKEDEHMKGSIQRALDWTRAVELVYDHASPLYVL